MDDAPRPVSIGSSAARGMVWSFGSYAGGRAVSLLTVAVLAHVLAPGEFGLIAIAVVFTTLLDRFAEFGISEALIVGADEREAPDRANTAWTFSVGLGLAMSAVTAACGPVAAALFDERELTWLLPVLGFNFALRATSLTHYALAAKRMDFRSRTIAEMADVALRAVGGIGLAFAGAGVYSIAVGYLIGTTARSVVLWRLIRWRPRPRIVVAELRPLLRFGGGLSALDILAAVTGNVDYVFIGWLLGAEALGYYTLGFRLPEAAVISIGIVAGRVLFPAFATLRGAELGRAFLVTLRAIVMLALPTTLVLVVLAHPLVTTLFGARWSESVAPMQLLSLYAFALAVGFPAGVAYKSMGRVSVLLRLSVPYSIVVIASIALFAERGIVTVAACQAIASAAFALVALVVASRILGVGLREMAGAVAPVLGASAAMAASLLVITGVVDSAHATLALGLTVGPGVYLAVLWLLARDAIDQLIALAVSRRAGAVPRP